MVKKPKCVMILTEGRSDRAALSGFFTDLYARIDSDIEVFFPVLCEESIDKEGNIETNYDGDITSRNGINEENILPLILKLFVHPELCKHPAYEYPSSVVEIIHLVDIDGVYLDDNQIVSSESGIILKHPYYDIENNKIVANDRDVIIDRNRRKRANLEKLVNTKRIRITMTKDANASRDKRYRVFYFSANLDHVLFGNANNESFNKIPEATKFANRYYNDSDGMADFFVNHVGAVSAKSYQESWDFVKSDNKTLTPRTNINILINELISKTNQSR